MKKMLKPQAAGVYNHGIRTQGLLPAMMSNDLPPPEHPDDTPETQKHRRSALYDVVVINTFGELDADARVQAQQYLVKALKATPEQIAHLFDNESTVIKRGVDTDKARRYATVLRDAGLECRLEYVRPPVERNVAKAVTISPPDFSATATQPTPRAIQLEASDKQYRMGLVQVIVGLVLLAGLLVMSMPQFSDLLTQPASVASTSVAVESAPLVPPVQTTVASIPPAANDNLQSVASTDGKATMQVPTDWDIALNMHPDAYLQTGNNRQQLYVLVMREHKNDAKKITLDEYVQAVERQMVDGQAGAVVVTLDNPEPIDKMPARGFELRLTRNEIDMVYLVAVAEDSDWFYQFIGLTPAANYERNKALMLSTVHTYSRKL